MYIETRDNLRHTPPLIKEENKMKKTTRKANPLDAISKRTLQLWYKVNEKYGDHAYSLGVNGLGEVVLDKGYTEELARGNRNAQRVLRELLKD